MTVISVSFNDFFFFFRNVVGLIWAHEERHRDNKNRFTPNNRCEWFPLTILEHDSVVAVGTYSVVDSCVEVRFAWFLSRRKCFWTAVSTILKYQYGCSLPLTYLESAAIPIEYVVHEVNVSWIMAKCNAQTLFHNAHPYLLLDRIQLFADILGFISLHPIKCKCLKKMPKKNQMFTTTFQQNARIRKNQGLFIRASLTFAFG